MQSRLVALSTLLNKEVGRVFRIWQQSLVPPVVTMTLYFIIFGNFLGQHIGLIEGVPYIQFIIPGFIMMGAINNAYANVSSSYFSAKLQNNIDELLIAPIPYQLVMWGYILGGVVRGVLVAILVYIVSLFFLPTPLLHPFIALSALILAMILFSLAGFINALYAKSFDDISLVPNFILLPLTYLGGVFYSVHRLPYIWQKISECNPILYMVNALRYGVIGYSDTNIYLSFAMIISVIMVLYGIAWYMVKHSSGIRS